MGLGVWWSGVVVDFLVIIVDRFLGKREIDVTDVTYSTDDDDAFFVKSARFNNSVRIFVGP